MKFTVYYKLSSTYENSSENKTYEYAEDVESSDLDSLLDELEEQQDDDFNDDEVINFNANSDCILTNSEYIKIEDETGKIVYKDE